ncbi:MAG: type II toxin-antitoxin system PemK/MazF family toxin [Patescibacteria group bacterium]
MQKDFDGWNELKKKIDGEKPRLYTVREIWWCRLGINIGSEQNGSGRVFLRPVVIIRSFGPTTCLVLPLTTSTRRHRLRVPIGKVQDIEASALVSQIRVIDTRRLVEKIGFLEKDVFVDLRKALNLY